MKFIPFLGCIIALLCTACQSNKNTADIRPNILFAIADDVSFPHMGAYGCSWVKTPAFDRVAEHGLLFQNAYTPNAKCAPSRSIIITGRNSWQLEAAANHWPFFPEKFKSVWETLKEYEYFTGHVAKGWGPGYAKTADGEKRELTGPAYNDIKLTPPTKHIATQDYAANFEQFLHEKPADIPFCFWYGALEPHRAYEYGAGHRVGGKSISQIDDLFGFFPENDSVKQDLLDYAFEIEHFDRHLNRMLHLLEGRGELNNTVVVVTADNGMPFPRVKGQVYERSNHLPLAIMWNNGIRDPGRSIEEFVSFTDFAPTFLDLAGVHSGESGMQPFEGYSLKDLFFNERTQPVRDHMIVGKERHDIGRPGDVGYPVRGIIWKDYLYLLNFKPDRWPAGNPETGYLNVDASPTKTVILHKNRYAGESDLWDLAFGKRSPEEIYHLPSDPDCLNNLVGKEEVKEIQQLLKTQLLTELKAQGDPRVLGEGDVFDRFPYSGEVHRGFYEKFMQGEIVETDAGWVVPDDFEKPLTLK